MVNAEKRTHNFFFKNIDGVLVGSFSMCKQDGMHKYFDSEHNNLFTPAMTEKKRYYYGMYVRSDLEIPRAIELLDKDTDKHYYILYYRFHYYVDKQTCGWVEYEVVEL